MVRPYTDAVIQCHADLWAAVSPYFQHMTDGVIIETVLVCSSTSGHQVLSSEEFIHDDSLGGDDMISIHGLKVLLIQNCDCSFLLTGAGCWLVLVSAQLQFYLRRRRNLSGVIFVFSQTWGSSIKWWAGGFSYLLLHRTFTATKYKFKYLYISSNPVAEEYTNIYENYTHWSGIK